MKKLIKIAAFVGATSVLWGCGGAQLTRGDILKHYDKVNQLSSEVGDAEGKEGALLAPEGFAAVKEILDEAVESAIDGEKTDANTKAELGLGKIANVKANMKTAREEFEETLQTRERARLEGASSLYAEEFASADAEFKEAANLIEENDVTQAREERIELQALYADLELRALKEGKKAAAEAAVEHAETLDADDWAPKTFHKAAEELKLVTSVLEADRTQKEKADAHAAKTIWLAGRALAITELAQMFDDGDYELEDILLWHQEQLEKVNQPLNGELPFDEADAKVVQSIQNEIAGLLKSIGDMRANVQQKEKAMEQLQKDHEKAVAKLLKEHSKQLAQLQSMSSSEVSKIQSEVSKIQQEAADRLAAANAAINAESEKKRKYEYVANLFSASEATVSRQEDDIMLNIHGFDFPTRGTGIGSENYGLLDKLVSAINKFPGSEVIVTGHTDSKGSKDRNYRLSVQRAEGVAKFLGTLGGIDSSRVNSRGMGEDKPIAPNDTRDGRAKNRRIEIVIKIK